MILSTVQLTRKGQKDKHDKSFYPWKQVLPGWKSTGCYFVRFVPWLLYKWTRFGKRWTKPFNSSFPILPKSQLGKTLQYYHLTDALFLSLVEKIEVSDFTQFWEKAVSLQRSNSFFECLFGFPNHFVYMRV